MGVVSDPGLMVREVLRREQPDGPLLCFTPSVLRAAAHRFIRHFPGRVTYAVKANPAPAVLQVLHEAGVTGFDVASLAEIEHVRQRDRCVDLHYHNPVRSRGEIARALLAGIASWSIDSGGELQKLLDAGLTRAVIAVRFRLPVPGARYDFGSKFGADPEAAALLLRRVADAGLLPALTFHPGTQCESPQAWVDYIHAAGRISRSAAVQLAQLNVGGGFPTYRSGAEPPDLSAYFAAIGQATAAAFGSDAPALVCEPGRALAAEAFTVALRVKAIRSEDGAVFLNDGIYGLLAEWPVMGSSDRVRVFASRGAARVGSARPRTVFGPTCDSLDRLPEPLSLPADLREGDYLVVAGVGAYSTALTTRFNGYGNYQEMVN